MPTKISTPTSRSVLFFVLDITFVPKDHDGLSALICAATMGQLEMAKRLLDCDMVEVNLQVRNVTILKLTNSFRTAKKGTQR